MLSQTLQAWAQLDALAHDAITPIQDDLQYKRAMALLAELWEVQDDPAAAGLIDLVADRIQAYEDRQFPAPEVSPAQALAFLMEQHGLKQKDLQGFAPQSVISEVLSGKRGVSVPLAKGLAERFHVPLDTFL